MTSSNADRQDGVREIIFVYPGPDKIQNHARADRGMNKNLLAGSSAQFINLSKTHCFIPHYKCSLCSMQKTSFKS